MDPVGSDRLAAKSSPGEPAPEASPSGGVPELQQEMDDRPLVELREQASRSSMVEAETQTQQMQESEVLSRSLQDESGRTSEGDVEANTNEYSFRSSGRRAATLSAREELSARKEADFRGGRASDESGKRSDRGPAQRDSNELSELDAVHPSEPQLGDSFADMSEDDGDAAASYGGEGMGEMGGGMGGIGGGVAPEADIAGERRPDTRQLQPLLLGIGPSATIDEVETDKGRGPGMAGDRFDPITDNPFQRVSEHPLSTFSVDVDTASYSKVRDFLLRAGRLPRPDAVRIEELVNYFDYEYEAPAGDDEHPFNAHVDVTGCPWNDDHRLARIAIQGQRLDRAQRPQANLVFLIDTSGSMNAPNRLPLVQRGIKLLLEQLDDDDRVAIVVYAGSAGQVLDSTQVKEPARIRRALTELTAGGSTNGGAGISLAYQTARDHFIPGGVNQIGRAHV